jgi:heavy metal translocating P-type ATPase
VVQEPSTFRGYHMSEQRLTHNLVFWIAVFTVVAIAVHLILWGVGADFTHIPLIVAIILGGIPLIWNLISSALRREFGADMLAGVSIITSLILGEYLAGAIVVLMLSGGATLESYAMGRASAVLAALAKRSPTIAHRRTGSEISDIPVSEVVVGDLVVVLPHETAPVDGIVREGHGTMDESYLTGEPYKVSKAPGATVLSGAINGVDALTVEATQIAADSRYARIMTVMEDASQTRPRIRRLADKLGAWYTPLALVIAGLAWMISGDPVRFLAVLVVATPCPLLIAIPVALLGAISLAASRTIIIKDTSILEQIDRCTTLILDKTGTLTLGSPSVTNVEGPDVDRGLLYAAALERYSKHPLGSAIVEAAEGRADDLQVDSMSERPGEGLSGIVAGVNVKVTGRSKLVSSNHPDAGLLPETRSGLECIVLIDGNYAATIHLHDQPRTDGKPFIQHLRPNHQFTKVMIVSGDRESEVAYLAQQVGIEIVHAGCTPEEKVEIVRAETALAPTLFVGDGINDAPALMTATCGVAFGQTNEVTTEAAGAVILEPSLRRLDELFHISSRFRSIALQSAIGGMTLSIFGMGFAAFGVLTPVMGAVAQEVIDLVAILNSLRVAMRPGTLSDV